MSQFDRLKELCSEGYCNVDKDGRPVYITQVKKLKASEIFKEFTDD